MNSNHEKLLKWLESHPNGRMIQTFGSSTQPTLDDIADAKRFAEGMRKNIGNSGIATVEVSYNRVIIQIVAEVAVHK